MGVLGFLGGFSDASTRAQAQGGQNRMQALDAMLRLKLLSHQLQQDQLRQAAISKLAPDQQQEMLLGGSIEDIKNRAEKRATATAMAGEFEVRASDTTLPPTQRIQSKRIAQYMRAHPEAAENLPATLKLFNIGEKPTKPFIPNALSARAMQILGTTDPSALGQHPEALVQAQKEDMEQRRRIALEGRNPPQPPAETPVSPSDIVKLPNGKTGYWAHARGSRPIFVETPGATPASAQPPKPRQWTGKNAVDLYNATSKQAKEDLSGRFLNASASHIRRETIKRLETMGYNVRGGGAWPRPGTPIGDEPSAGETVETP